MKWEQFHEQLMKRAVAEGLTEAEVYAEQSTSLTVKVFRGEVDAYETSEEGGVGFRAVYDGQMGYAYTENIEESSIPFLIQAVKEQATVVEREEVPTIFEGSETYELVKDERPIERIDPMTLMETLQEIEAGIVSYDPRIERVSTCGAQQFESVRHIMNTHGLSLREQSDGLVVYASAIAEEKSETKSSFVSKIIHDWDAFSVEDFVKEVGERAVRALGGKPIPSTTYPVILRNDTATALLSTFISSYSAEQVQKGMSRLANKIGESIASSIVTIEDDPNNPNVLHRCTFDGEGVATRRRTIVKEGVLQTLLHNRQTAQREGVSTTGHAYRGSYKGTIGIAPHHFVVKSSTETREALLHSVEEGVYVTHIAGLHAGANVVSGDFSLAAQGFYVQNGRLVHPISSMTIAGNYFELLQQIERVANDPHYGFSRLSSPTLHVRSLAITVEQ